MSQVELISRLLPSIPELNEILTKIRRDYLIEEVLPENKALIESTSQQYTVEEWEAIRQEIEDELRAWFQSKSAALVNVVKLFEYLTDKSQKNKAFLMGKFAKVPEKNATEFAEEVNRNTTSGLASLDQFYKGASEKLLSYLLTGRPIEIPAEFFDIVITMTNSSNDKYVFAVAHLASDPDEIAEKFRNRAIEVFGKKPQIEPGGRGHPGEYSSGFWGQRVPGRQDDHLLRVPRKGEKGVNGHNHHHPKKFTEKIIIFL